VTVLLNNPNNTQFKEIADHNINTLMELVRDLERGKIAKVRSNIMRENRKLTPPLPLWPNETNK
jgi:hypothetical protein